MLLLSPIHIIEFASDNTCCTSKNSPKSTVAITKNLPSTTRDAIIRGFIENKADSGDFIAAAAFRPEAAEHRITARAASIRDTVNDATTKLV